MKHDRQKTEGAESLHLQVGLRHCSGLAPSPHSFLGWLDLDLKLDDWEVHVVGLL